jgi:hypothetical protein
VVAVPVPKDGSDDFDPLRDFAGMWNTTLAERYLPLPGHPFSKYECVDGRLFVSPAEASSNSYGKLRLAALMEVPARAAGLVVYGSINLRVNPDTWIEPDVTLLRHVPDKDSDGLWVPADHCALAVEFVSRSSRRRDVLDRPAVCGPAGIPYFMHIEIVRRLQHVEITLARLGAKGVHSVMAEAISGQVFEMSEPFKVSFDPAELLEP